MNSPISHGVTQLKVTIYTCGIMGINAIEARLLEHGYREYAQYAAAAFVNYIPKGARGGLRSARGIVQGRNPSILIVEGWGQPSPDGIYDESTSTETDGGAVVTRGRYSSCDPRWREDFDAMIAASNVKIVADYRS